MKITGLIAKFFRYTFPISKKNILIFSYYGSQYGCNPKYLSEYINSNSSDLNIIWAFTQPEKYTIEGVKKVKVGSLKYYYYLSTSHFIVTNYRMPIDYIKAKGQLYIQTWHSSLRLKKIEGDVSELLPQNYLNQAVHDSNQIDLLLSGCAFSSNIFRHSFWYEGEILECGTPRIDTLLDVSPEFVINIKDVLGISSGNKVLLYAPTFRQSDSFDQYLRDFETVKSTLHRRFGDEWTVLVRLHPHLINKRANFIDNSQVIDVTSYDDVQELLKISDFLITDYSSLMFDFAILRKPVLLYMPDYDDYISGERSLYFDLTDLPFLKSFKISDIESCLVDFDELEYSNNNIKFLDSIGSFENGSSSKRVLEFLNSKINE